MSDEEKKTYSTRVMRAELPEVATLRAGSARVRVKLDRTIKIGVRRYRPGEIVEEPVPAENQKDVEPWP